MSDLQCAANLLIVRRAEAEFDTDRLTDGGGSLTLRGREQSRALGDSLRSARVAMIYSSPMARAVQTSEIVAAVLGVPVRVREGLREFSVGDYAGKPPAPDLVGPTFGRWLAGDLDATVPGGESGREVVDRFRVELETAADLHRGEHVLVVSHGGAICAAVSAVAQNIPGDYPLGRMLGYCDRVEVAVDSDGWVARSWAGQPV